MCMKQTTVQYLLVFRCCFRDQNCVCPSKPCQNYYEGIYCTELYAYNSYHSKSYHLNRFFHYFFLTEDETEAIAGAQNPDPQKLFNTWFPVGSYTPTGTW